MRKTNLLPILATVCSSLALLDTASAQGTAFTYQGQLSAAGAPANGLYDMTFSLYGSSSEGIQYGNTLTNTAVGVTNGLFTTTMDFGSWFNGTPYWLQIGVRTNGSGAFTSLTSRQELTPIPYAIYAESAGSSALVSDPGTENFFAGQFAGSPTLIGTHNTGVGYSALDSITSGVYNTAFGDSALLYDTAGSDNTAYGVYALKHNTTGGNNTALGADVLASNTTGDDNTGVGLGAMESNSTGTNNVGIGNQALLDNTTGSRNTATGNNALNNNVSGTDNTAVGWQALTSSTGSYNTALGDSVLLSNTTASYNTATGYKAMVGPILGGITTGGYNSAYGAQALAFDSTGTNNTAVGVYALEGATTANNNTADGAYALGGNLVTGSSDTGIGVDALFDLSTGYNNVAAGYEALYANTSGFDNVGIGASTFQANATGSQNTAIGTYAFQDMTVGSGNIGIGISAGISLSSGSDNIYIGSPGASSDNNAIRIGNAQTDTYIAGEIHDPVVNQITIVGGSDLAEPFDLTAATREIPQGSVVVIDDENPGRLKISDQPYDTRVAGVLSGANGIHPGIQMRQEGTLDSGKNVALSGRVYVQAGTSNGAIKPGDLLTTSSSPGEAMKVTDHVRAQGAILGKAMTGLKEGKGMVLVLVTLQ